MSKPKYTAHISTIQCIVYSGFSPSVIFLATNFSTSSSNTTGIENFITIIHSTLDRGVTWNTACGWQETGKRGKSEIQVWH